MIDYVIQSRWDNTEPAIWDHTTFVYFDLQQALKKLQELRDARGHNRYRLLKVTRTDEVVA